MREEWIDYNGHLSEPYYVLVLGHATDEVMDSVGLGPDYRETHRCLPVHRGGTRALPRPGGSRGAARGPVVGDRIDLEAAVDLARALGRGPCVRPRRSSACTSPPSGDGQARPPFPRRSAPASRTRWCPVPTPPDRSGSSHGEVRSTPPQGLPGGRAARPPAVRRTHPNPGGRARTTRWSSSERSERTVETRRVEQRAKRADVRAHQSYAGPDPGGRAASEASDRRDPGGVRRAGPRWSSSERSERTVETRRVEQ